ncbi:hypothetical protein ACC848_45070, partial [Rhizobium johnstonii]
VQKDPGTKSGPSTGRSGIGDNCRDPFFAYGDHDMLDTWRQAVRILHIDHPYGDEPALAGPAPAGIMGIDAGTIGVGR